MRYGHMVRHHQSNLPVPPSTSAPRKFRPISKRANTLALDVRHSLTAARAPVFGLLLLATPFTVALLTFLTGSRSPKAISRFSRVHSDLGRLHNHHGDNRTANNSDPITPEAQLVSIELGAYLKQLQVRRKKVKFSDSITLIAACQDRHESLLMSYPSWSSQSQLSQIVLVEWSSAQYDWHKIPHLTDDLHSGRLSVVLVNNAGPWALSRAYNLGSQFVLGQHVVKVDCDTHLLDDFFSKHAKPANGEYYTVTWGTPRTTNEDHLRGVWYGRLSDFRKVGGYDERLVFYGYEDVDYYNRLNAAGLTAKSIDLDVVRHNVGPDLIYHHEEHYIISRRVSIRTNEELLKSLRPWSEVQKEQANEYNFAYDKSKQIVVSNVTRHAPDSYHTKSEQEQKTLLSNVLQTGLHDDFGLPWDILQHLTYEDLNYLGHFLDTDSDPHIIVVLLEGPDTLSNLFNLVSAVQLAMIHGRPTVVVWNAPGGAHVTNIKGPVLNELFDMTATNAQILNRAKSEEIRKYVAMEATTDIRVLAAEKWCDEGLSTCAKKYDRAYEPFIEVSTRLLHAYDEVDPLPISTSRHTLVRLGAKTKVGNPELRSLAYKTLVPSAAVREAQQLIGGQAKLGVVVDSEDAAQAVKDALHAQHQDFIESGTNKLLPIVGTGQSVLRKLLIGNKDNDKFCEGVECTMKQMAVEVANVLGACEAVQLFPAREFTNDRTEWVNRSDISYMMLADLHAAHKG